MGFKPPPGSFLPTEDGKARCFLGPFWDYVERQVAGVDTLSETELDELRAHLHAHNETCDDRPQRCGVCQWYTFLDEHPPEEWASYRTGTRVSGVRSVPPAQQIT